MDAYKWISCRDKMPPTMKDNGRYRESMPVLAYLGDSNGRVMVVTSCRWYSEDDNPFFEEIVWLNPSNDRDDYDVTHWQYLPIAPTMEN
jgi:hypothetical protein